MNKIRLSLGRALFSTWIAKGLKGIKPLPEMAFSNRRRAMLSAPPLRATQMGGFSAKLKSKRALRQVLSSFLPRVVHGGDRICMA